MSLEPMRSAEEIANKILVEEVNRLTKAEKDLDAQIAIQANEPSTKTDGYMAGLLNEMLLAKANFGHEYNPVSYKATHPKNPTKEGV